MEFIAFLGEIESWRGSRVTVRHLNTHHKEKLLMGECRYNLMLAFMRESRNDRPVILTSVVEGMKILFRIRAAECCESAALTMPANLENSAVATGLEKVSFHSNSKEGQCQRQCSNYCTIALISHASKVMLKIIQARLQQYVNCEFPRCSSWF